MSLSAQEVSSVLHSMRTLDEYAVKTAEVADVSRIEAANAGSASALYGVMSKEASFAPDGSNPFRMCRLVTKLAQDLGKPVPDALMQLKVAAAVAVDDAFEQVLGSDVADTEKAKVAELRLYGREYLAELLRGVI